jgi:acyl carrier protein
MFELVESRVRRIVAEHLGVGPEELGSDVSLTDNLAADSLDLVELALALEGEFDINVPETVLDSVRTYGDLVECVCTLTRKRALAASNGRRRPVPPALVWARVLPSHQGGGMGDLERTGWLTPYTAEEITEDALRAGRGARLELLVPSSTNDAGLAQLQDRFAWLRRRGVQVSVRRDEQLDSPGQRSHPHAAA